MTPAALEDARPFWELLYLNARQAARDRGYDPCPRARSRTTSS